MKREYQRLPRELAANLLAAERRDVRVAAFQSMLGLLFVLGAVFLPFLALERLWAFPRPLRGAALMLALAGAGWFVCGWLGRRWRRRRDPFVTIRRIERHYPELGDSLRGVIELAEDDAARTGISESLRLAAVRQVGERCRALDFGAAISTARLRTYGRRVGAVALVLVVCAWFEPELLGNALARFVRPWAVIPRYSFARVEPLPAVLAVARGEAFSVPVRLAGTSRWNPDHLSFRLGRGERKTRPVERGQAVLDLPGITEPSSLHVRLGDAVAVVRLEPVPRPALLELVGEATLPDYLARPAEAVEFVRSRTRLVEGSQVVLRGTVLNPLARAWLAEGETEFTVADHDFLSPSLPAGELAKNRLLWQDRHGLQPVEPYRLDLEVVPDAPPAVQFEGVLRIFAMLEGEVLDLPLLASDDYGVRGVEVAWEVRPVDRSDAPPSASERRSVGTGAPDRTTWSGTFVFSPQRLGIPAGSKATLRALAADYKPGRPFSESHPVEVIVMTPEDHARLVENLLATLRNRMEEATLREAQQLLDNEDLARLSDEELRQPEAQRRLEKQAELERRSVEDWQRLAEEGAKLLAEATRNESFPAETLAEWTATMEVVRQVSAELLPQAATALAQAGQAPEQRRESLDQAIAAQREAFEKLKQSAGKMGDSLDQFAVLNLAARLRALAERERGVGGMIQQLFPQTIGMTAADLPPPLADRVRRLADSQGDVQQQVFSVQFEVRRCLENTGIEKYEWVLKAMAEAKLTEDMPKARLALAENRLAQAAGEVQRWAKSLDEWATLLDGKQDGGGGGGGGGGGEMSEEAIQFMLALLRTIQEQDRIRRDTAGLETEKDRADYARQAERLAEAEAGLAETVGELARKLRPSEARNNIEDAQNLMKQAGKMLREPRTDLEVQADMGSAIELLLTLFESNCQGGQCQASSMLSMMAQSLRVGMRLGAGAAGGGSRAGGPFGGAGGTVGGGAGSGGGEGRGGSGAVDAVPAEFPAEYRGLLERFFQNVEAE